MYYIYHIPGIKIGCTKYYPQRCIDQGFNSYELIETHEDVEIASNREIELQIQYGYGRDSMAYTKTLEGVEASKRVLTRETRAANLMIGRQMWYGTEAYYNHQRNANPNLGRSNVESGHWDNITKIGRAKAHEHIACEHCGKTTNRLNHGRYHGNKCKYKI